MVSHSRPLLVPLAGLVNGVIPSTASGSESLCLVGAIYNSTGERAPKHHTGYWPSWTGRNWEATQTARSQKRNDTSNVLNGGSLAGIIIGVIFSFCGLIFGIFLSVWLTLRRMAAHAERMSSTLRSVHVECGHDANPLDTPAEAPGTKSGRACGMENRGRVSAPARNEPDGVREPVRATSDLVRGQERAMCLENVSAAAALDRRVV